jgi:hypothetical protein
VLSIELACVYSHWFYVICVELVQERGATRS